MPRYCCQSDCYACILSPFKILLTFSQYLPSKCDATHHAHACMRAVKLQSYDEAAQGYSLCVGPNLQFREFREMAASCEKDPSLCGNRHTLRQASLHR